ncbi:hypothetical protein Unana1_05472 [Umbelopsis nana]
MSSMDIDMPLEDVIKKDRAQKKSQPRRGGNRGGNRGKPTPKQQPKPSRVPVQSQRGGGKITKGYASRAAQAAPKKQPFLQGGTPKPRTLVTAGNRGGFTTAALRSRAKANIDPASIVITKQVTPKQLPVSAPKKHTQPAPKIAVPQQATGSRIRGISAGAGISIRGESGPTVVLVRNLDPGANADDVRTAFLSFGEVLNCELAIDRSGRSMGEAEVEFANRADAVRAVQQLDGELADGRVLRLTLRDKVASSKPARGLFEQSVRSMISPRSESRLYSDHLEQPRSSIFDRR